MEDYTDWITAGRIASEAREFSRSLIKPGVRILDIAEKVEAKIVELGAQPAFPVNISFNEIAAHYTPVLNDDKILSDQVVKIDIGVSYNGAIGDCAYTVDLSGKYADLVKASEEALANAKKVMQIGTTLGEIGKTIQETINSHGFVPVKNLCGHGLERYKVHAPPQFANYNTGDKTELENGMIFALEPFATNGSGLVQDSGQAMIFSQSNARPVRDMTARKLLNDISELQGLPFATRLYAKEFGDARLRLALRSLQLAGNVTDYPPLAEVKKGMVSQAEDSFVIDDKVICTTKP